MPDFEQHAQELERVEVPEGHPEIGVALEASKDALTFVQSLHNAFMMQGVEVPDEPDIHRLENLVDAYFCELAAATMLLSNTDESVERLRKIAGELNDQVNKGANVDNQAIQGFVKLADRIEATQAVMRRVMEAALLEKT
jgi:hypothetical protein